MNGFSIYIAFGSWARPQFELHRIIIRLVVGWVSIVILPTIDLDKLFANTIGIKAK
jgi:hypothetical protein